jgi:hypothetical protein
MNSARPVRPGMTLSDLQKANDKLWNGTADAKPDGGDGKAKAVPPVTVYGGNTIDVAVRDSWNIVKRLRGWELLEGTGTDGGDWGARGPDKKLHRFDNRSDAEEHIYAETNEEYGDSAKDAPKTVVKITGSGGRWVISWNGGSRTAKSAEEAERVASEKADELGGFYQYDGAKDAKSATVVVVNGEWFYRIDGETLRFGPFHTATEAVKAGEAKGLTFNNAQVSSVAARAPKGGQIGT